MYAPIYMLRRDGQAALEWQEEGLVLAREHGFSMWLAAGDTYRGWAVAEQGQGEEGIAQMRQGIANWQAIGSEAYQTQMLVMLAESHGKMGQAEEGLDTLAEAHALRDKTGERWYEAELYRLAGELSLRMGEQETGRTGEKEIGVHSPILPLPHSSPEECFHKAIAIARRQSAKSWELRAVMSLSRLWQQQGKREEARQMLAEIYGWFTEGFDTADLKEAKTLLAELS